MINIDRYGNTTAGTIPLATRDAIQQGRLKKGDMVLFAAVGAGYTVGASLWRWAYLKRRGSEPLRRCQAGVAAGRPRRLHSPDFHAPCGRHPAPGSRRRSAVGLEHLFVVDLHLVGAAGLQPDDEDRLLLVQRHWNLRAAAPKQITASSSEIGRRIGCALEQRDAGHRENICIAPSK